MDERKLGKRLIHLRVESCHSERTRQAGGMGHTKLMKFNEDKYKVQHPWWNNPLQWFRWGTDWLDNISAEKHVGIPVDIR